MNQLLADPIPHISAVDLHRFQQKVSRVALKIIVEDGDGKQVCRLSAGTVLEKPLPTWRALLVQLVEQWSGIHNDLMSRVRRKRFGHLPPGDITMMEVLTMTGALLLSGLREVHSKGETEGNVGNHVMDLTHSLKALANLQASYESNPSDEELDALAMSAE